MDLVRVAAAALNLAANEVKHRARVFVEVSGAARTSTRGSNGSTRPCPRRWSS